MQNDSFSTAGNSVSAMGVALVLWRLFGTVEGQHKYRWGDSISAVEGIQH